MKRRILTAAMAILALSLVVSCKPTPAPTPTPKPVEVAPTPVPPTPTPKPEPIKIGLPAPLSGVAKIYGESHRNGVLMAIDEWNEKGGVLGRPIEPVLGDTKLDATEGANVGNRLVYEDKVKYISGPPTSPDGIQISKIADKEGVVEILSSATAIPVTVYEDGSNKEYVFRVCFLDSFQGEADAAFARDDLGAETAAVLYDVGNDYVKGLAEFFKAALEERGGKVVVYEAYTVDDTDFSAILTRVAEAEPDVLFLPDFYNRVNLITAQAKEKGIKAQLLGGDGWDSAGLDLETTDGGYFSTHYSPADPRPIVKDFIAAYKEKYDMGPDFIGVLAYDATNVLLQAIESAGVDDPAAVKDAVAAIEFEGVAGRITFDEYGNCIKNVAFNHISGGKVEFLKFVVP